MKNAYIELSAIAGCNNVRKNEPMSAHTSFKIGGPADLLVIPENSGIVAEVVRYCRKSGIPVFVMGNGTNLVVRDKGIRGVVIKLLDNLRSCSVEGTRIKADAGILLSKVSKIALEYGLEGLEFAEGIPGTLGGAVVMNAGAYTGDMSGVVEEIEYLDRLGNIRTLGKDELGFGKRTSFALRDGGIVLGAVLKLEAGDRSVIKDRMDNFCEQRREKQPLEYPSAGSVFKRPEGAYAGKLIQDCGLKGCRRGDAEVSEKHSGFIINRGKADAADVEELIRHIQETVGNKFGIELQTEIRIVGEE
ncbi:MAG: UDP-N-acetylmuramate dehydrogenase [Clostridiales bacterium]|nr:UDP-N-acetylmuramate dehydrogenase [Clostridiales bacterium]